MTEPQDHEGAVRELYTAQEIADLVLTWGGRASIIADAGTVTIEIERRDSTINLDLGPANEFYSDVVMRGYVFMSTEPHRFCDAWNEIPYYGAFSVVNDESGYPTYQDEMFVVRGAQVIDFDEYRSLEILHFKVMFFWFGLNMIQDFVTSGSTNRADFIRDKTKNDSADWWSQDDE